MSITFGTRLKADLFAMAGEAAPTDTSGDGSRPQRTSRHGMEVAGVNTSNSGPEPNTIDYLMQQNLLLHQQVQALAAKLDAHGTTSAREPKAVRSVDVSLDRFSGGHTSSTHIQPEQLSQFDAWFKQSVQKMRMLGLAPEQFVACLITHRRSGQGRLVPGVPD